MGLKRYPGLISRLAVLADPSGKCRFTHPVTGGDEIETVIISVNDYDSTRTTYTSSDGSCSTGPGVGTVSPGDFGFTWGDGVGTAVAPPAASGGGLPDPATGTKIAIAIFNFPSDSWFIDDSTPTWRLYRGDFNGCAATTDGFPGCLFAPRFLTKQ